MEFRKRKIFTQRHRRLIHATDRLEACQHMERGRKSVSHVFHTVDKVKSGFVTVISYKVNGVFVRDSKNGSL